MSLYIKRLDASSRDDYFDIHSSENDFGFCHCVFWRIPIYEDWGKRTPEENRKFREELFENGVYDGYLLYMDNVPIAWCQCCPIDGLVRLRERAGYVGGDDFWAIPCLLMKKEFRSKGHMKRMLEMVLYDLTAKGIKKVRAFPKITIGFDPMENWTGTEKMFSELGFKKIGERGKLAIYEKDI